MDAPPSRRIDAVDFVRGVALLGIFVMNVRDFGLPLAHFDRPGLAGGLGAGNVAAWLAGTLLFQDKMIALLSLLFGAGLVLHQRQSAADGRPATPAWLRRCAWLLLIGVAHAVLLWYGDILNTYAICGLLLWPLARLPVRVLCWIGALLYLVPLWFMHGPLLTALVREAIGAGDETSAQITASVRAALAPSTGTPAPARVPDVAAALRVWGAGSYRDTVRENLRLFVPWHLEGGWRISFWRSGGLMVLGMALARSGVLAAPPGDRRLARMLGWGLGLGALLVVAATASLLAADCQRSVGTDLGAWRPLFGALGFARRGLMHLGSGLVALGWLALLLHVGQRFAATSTVHALARVGRAALSCYLLQTLLACALFYGYGAARFGRMSFAELWLVIGAVWLLELELCRFWFARFAIGPCEWAWRSLAEWRRRPWRAAARSS